MKKPGRHGLVSSTLRNPAAVISRTTISSGTPWPPRLAGTPFTLNSASQMVGGKSFIKSRAPGAIDARVGRDGIGDVVINVNHVCGVAAIGGKPAVASRGCDHGDIS